MLICWLGFVVVSLSARSYVVIIPSYNNLKYWQQNLTSALRLVGSNYRVLYIDDASTDGTGQQVEQYLKAWRARTGSSLPVHIVHNPVRHGALSNWYRAIHACQPDEVIVSLDGDDALAHDQVLMRLEQAYARGCWLTYGQYLKVPGRLPASNNRPLNWQVPVREQPFCTSHLRTFYAGLFQQIKLHDLLTVNDRFYAMAGDVAMMMPMLEMGGARCHFIEDILYLYNTANPLGDSNRYEQQQIRLATRIMSQSSYEPVATYLPDWQTDYLILNQTNYTKSHIETAYVALDFGAKSADITAACQAAQRTGVDRVMLGGKFNALSRYELVSPLKLTAHQVKSVYVLRANVIPQHKVQAVVLARAVYQDLLKQQNWDSFMAIQQQILTILGSQNVLALYQVTY